MNKISIVLHVIYTHEVKDYVYNFVVKGGNRSYWYLLRESVFFK